MNILNVAGTFPPAWRGGGVPLMSHALAVALTQQGCSVLTVADNSNEGVRMDVPTGVVTQWDDADVVYVDRFVSRRGFMQSLEATVEEQADSADIILSRGNWRPHNWIVRRVARRHNIPYLLFPDGIFDPWAWQHHRLRKKLYWTLIERANYSHAACVVTMHSIEAQQVADAVDTASIESIPSGVHLPPAVGPLTKADVQRQIPGLGHHNWIISMSRIHPKKGIDILIDGFGRWAPQNPTHKLLIAGDGDPDYIRALQTQAEQHGIADRVLWPGLVTDDLKDGVLRYATAFTLISHSEGLPMGVLEALAYGLPVVITPYCNFPQVAQAEAGLIIEPTPEQVEDALERVVNAETGPQMGIHGAELVRTQYNWNAIADRLIEVCEGLIA